MFPSPSVPLPSVVPPPSRKRRQKIKALKEAKASSIGSAAALTTVFTGISAAASRVVTIALLVNVALVGRSNLLDYLSVAVVASNADGGVGEFLLDLHAWGEDDAACKS